MLHNGLILISLQKKGETYSLRVAYSYIWLISFNVSSDSMIGNLFQHRKHWFVYAPGFDDETAINSIINSLRIIQAVPQTTG